MKLPKGWKTGHVADFGKLVTGSTPSTANDAFFGGNVPFVTPGDLGGAAVVTRSERTLTIAGADQCRRLPTGSVMVVCIGSTIGKTGRAGVDLVTNQQINAVVPNSDTCGTFAFYEVSRIAKEFRRLAGTQAVPILSKSEFGDFPVNVPPLPEQRKIADILSTWDEALTQLDALIDAQERRKKALMQQLLTGKKRLPAFAKKPWKKVRMGEVLKRVFRPIEWSAEMTLSLVSLRRRCGGLFRRPDVLGADYKTQDLHELHADDFLISKRQVAHGAWGLVTSEFAGSHVSKEYAILVNAAPEKLHMPFFAWLSQTPRMIRLSRVASTGVHIEKLIFDPVVFLRDSIRLPSDLEEQRQIAALLDAADQQLTLLRTQRTALDQQKRGLMQRLLTGKLRVSLTQTSP